MMRSAIFSIFNNYKSIVMKFATQYPDILDY